MPSAIISKTEGIRLGCLPALRMAPIGNSDISISIYMYKHRLEMVFEISPVQMYRTIRVN